MKAIVGGRILTIARDVIEQGVVLVEDGKFVGVGAHLDVPEGAEVIDASGKYVVAGMIDAHTHVGLSQFSETTSPITPQVRVLDSVELDSPGFEAALAGGVTTIITGPGSSNVVGGTSIVIKTAGRDLSRRILRDPAGIKMAWRKGTQQPSQGPPYPVSLMGIAGLLRTTLVNTQNYMARRERGEVAEDPIQELMARALRRELPIRIHSFTPVELLAILRLQDEFGFDFTVEHGFEAHLVAEKLAERGIPVVYGPGPGSRRHKMFPNRGPHGAAILHRTGVKVSLQSDHPDRNIEELRVFGALLVRYTDLTPDEVLRMLTLNGAEIAGVSDRVGSIEPGKDADFTIFSDHPLRVQARVEKAFIDGEPVWQDGKLLVRPF